ncbi:sulfatase-like hydrolase/transferase [Natronoarchaeum sp. GCM10025321]|uniref:sulfatase-like hydrolase/transferase n=1 Tax=Natronoarchaeum sp. GCM10025321 TaxID=3252684 RepID=UPI00360B77B9
MARNSPLNRLNTDVIDNIYIFIADSVRYDFVPDRVTEKGVLFKTAAAGLCTPQSVSSIVTGRHVPRHGVTWFNDSLDRSISQLFDLTPNSGYNEVFWTRAAVQEILNTPGEIELDGVNEPFIALEHDNGGHAPYVGFRDQSPSQMFSEIPDTDSLRELYRDTVKGSTDRFEERLALLESQGLLENTLVIYLSDHGELLGEHGGFLGHGLPSTPEVAYVPTVFIHDSLSSDRADTLIQHVDLFPTIKEIVDGGNTAIDVDGRSLLGNINEDAPAYTNGLMRAPFKYRDTAVDPCYNAPSIWTRDGGYVFNDTRKYVRPMTATYDAFVSGYTGSFDGDRHRSVKLLHTFRQYLASSQSYGDPSLPKTEAREMVNRISNRSVEVEQRSLDVETKKQLEQLGYR